MLNHLSINSLSHAKTCLALIDQEDTSSRNFSGWISLRCKTSLKKHSLVMEAADVMTQCLPTNTISLLRLVLLFQVLWNVCSTSSIRSSTLQTVYPQRLNSIHFVFSPQDIDWNSWMSLKLKCYLKRPLLLSELLTKFILLERESTLKHFMAQNIHLTLSPDMISIIWHTCVTQFSAQEQSENSNAVDGSVIASKAATISPSSVP